MKNALFFLLTFTGLLLSAAEIQVAIGDKKVLFDSVGGGIRSIKWKNKLYADSPGSFTERVMADTLKNGKPAQFQERFDKLQFVPEITKQYSHLRELVFTARGTGAFDWLRIKKVYTVYKDKPLITLQYVLTNLDTKPHSAALWTRTFLRAREDGKNANIYLQPGNNDTTGILHPGPTVKADEWSVAPPKSWSAVYDPKSKRGAIVSFPYEKPAAFYSWFSLKEVLGTLEFITSERTLAPGKSTSFYLNITLSADVPSELKKPAFVNLAKVKPAAKSIYYPSYHAAGKERAIAFYQNLGGTLPRSADSMNLTVPRQYTPSLRELILPAKVDPATVAVFEVANKRADYSRELPSKVVKGADGSNRLLFLVSGIKSNFHTAKIAADGTFRTASGIFLGMADCNVEIAFDRKPSKTLDMKGFENGSDLVYNGSFTVPNVQKNYKHLPDGFPDNFYSHRVKWYNWKEGVFSVTRPSAADKWVNFGPYVVLEKDRKYRVSVKLRNDNRIKGVSIGSIGFFDAKGKALTKEKLRFYPGSSNAHEWKTFTKEFYTPANARYASVVFFVYGIKEQTLYIDDLQIVPQPYSAVQIKLVDRLRDQLKNSWYKPIDYIERNPHDVETPHTKWMKNSAVKADPILFLPMINGSYSSLERRLAAELAQRMDLSYKMIPLLRHVSYINGSGIMGVYRNTMESRLEPYTIERLKEVKQFPKVILLNGVDFKVTGKELTEFLKTAVKNKSKLFFVNCFNIPGTLLGKRLPLPSDLLLVPYAKQVPAKTLPRFLSLYANGAALDLAQRSFFANPTVPASEIANRYPDLIGRDYPFTEYGYLTAVRVLRYLSGADKSPKILSAKADGDVLVLKTTTLPQGAVLKNGYRWANDYFPLADLKVSGSEIKVPLTELPEKLSVLEFQLIDAKGKTLDAGAVAVTRPDTLKLAVKGDKKSFRYGQKVEFSVSLPALPAGMSLKVLVEDNDRRVVYSSVTTKNELKVSFVPAAPVAAFYRILASVEGKGRTPARELGEFTITGIPRDPADLLTVMWPGGDSAKYSIYRKHGYDQLIVWCRDNTPALRALRSAGIEPVIFGLGTSSYGHNFWKAYKDDKATDDPVRKPCFSDNTVVQKAEKTIRDLMTGNKLDYYGITHQLIGDEQYIGSTVCFSEHCLKEFRKVLQSEFKSLAALNSSWGTSFKTWNEVTPAQSKELTDRSKLGRWLDHKIFMNNVFAHSYIGSVRKAMQKIIPESRTGLSGTYNPGPTYEWKQIMKEVNYVAYYSGIQRKLAQDFGPEGLFGGQWYGGYVAPTPHDGYASSHFWRGFLIGANLSPIYAPRAGITGDLHLTPVLKCYDRILKESRQGLGKLILSSKEVPRIAVLYSQRSLFACTGTIGASEWQNANTGWHTLLGDLGMDYRFIDKEILEEKGVAGQFKVLILPAAIALSDKEIKQIETFVRNGGTVIADMVPGLYDEHGALRKQNPFAARFGAASAAIPSLVQVTIDCKGSPAGVPAVKGAFRTTAGKNDFFHLSTLGKGSFVGINLLLSGYQTVTLGGTGGETAQATSGAAAFCSAWRTIAKGALLKAGVRPHREIRNAKNQEAFAESCWRSNGDNHVLGLLKFDTSVPVIDPKQGEKVTVKLPVKGHVYDLRKHTYLGNTDTLKVLLVPARGEFFSVMKEKVSKVTLTALQSVTAGSMIKFSAKALTESGKSAGKVVFHWQLTSPSGKVYDRYTGNLLSDGSSAVSHSFQSAFNDEKGVWQLSVVCVNSGTKSADKITIK